VAYSAGVAFDFGDDILCRRLLLLLLLLLSFIREYE
jgi:hypothetical protein